jgi:uncharacterized protein YxeA
MKLILIISISVLLSLSCSTVKNTSRIDQYDRGATYEVQSTKKSKRKKSKYSLAGQYDKKIEEYEERMEANARKYRKMAKEMEKPQYSDPSYFGHKKKPKKRPPGKKKFCKECGMYH